MKRVLKDSEIINDHSSNVSLMKMGNSFSMPSYIEYKDIIYKKAETVNDHHDTIYWLYLSPTGKKFKVYNQ